MPRVYKDDEVGDSGSDDKDDNLPASTSRTANFHSKSNPTTKSGVKICSIGLKVAGFNERRQPRVCEWTNNKRFSASFGVSAETLEAVFIDTKKKDPALTEQDFLMGVDTLKLYLTEHNMAGRWDYHEQTYRGEWKEVAAAIAALRDEKIRFDPSDFPEMKSFY